MWAGPFLPISNAPTLVQVIITTCLGFCNNHLLKPRIRSHHNPDDNLPVASHYPLQTMQSPCLASKTTYMVWLLHGPHSLHLLPAPPFLWVQQTPSFPLTQQTHSCTSTSVLSPCLLFLQICLWVVSSCNSGLRSNVTSSERSSRSPSNCFPTSPSVFSSPWNYLYLKLCY